MTVRSRVLGAAILAAAAGRAGSAAPVVIVEPEVLNFGQVRADDTTLVRRLRIMNRGDEPLQIEGVESGCGCAEARLEHEIVPAGAATELVVRLNLLGRRGSYRRDLIVRSNDPRRPSVRIPVVADIVSPWELTPTGITLGELEPNQRATQSLRLTLNPPTGRVISVTASAPWLRGSAYSEAPGVWRIEVTTVPPYPVAGWLAGRLLVTTDRPDLGPIHVDCTAVIRQPLIVMPTELRVAPDGPRSHFVLISGGDARSIEVTQVELAGCEVRWRVRRLSDGTLQVRLEGLPTTHEWDGRELVIHTTAPHAHPLRVILRVPPDR